MLVPSSELADECRARDRFVKERLTRPATREELKDLTDFFHQEDADILVCDGCTLLIRHPHEALHAQTYSEDEYDPTVMGHLYPRYVEAFRAKEKPYRALLPAGARVLEIGSHYGAFLHVSAEWQWRAVGVDIGKDTTQFARSKGFTVHGREVNECGFPENYFDGVFIWNCFEQIADPKPTLVETRRILKPGGLLVVRTPNGLFYSLCHRLFKDPNLVPTATGLLVRAMAYHNLLGFPYLYGYSGTTLERFIEPFGFTLEGMLNSELITLPLPDSPEWVDEEEHEINGEIRMLARSVLSDSGGVLTGPWIEVWFRSVT